MINIAKRLFVGGLPYTTTDEQLTELFAAIGKISSANVIVDKYTNQGKGFGFVEYEDDKDADKAIEQLNNTEFGGRNIVVNEARPREERGPREFGRGNRQGRGGGRDSGRDPGRGRSRRSY